MTAQVGLDPHTHIDWIYRPQGSFMALFAREQVDAFLGFPPEPQELRARGVGHVLLNMATDRPWSHYFCCTMFGNRALSALIRSPPSASCAPCSRRPTSAPPSRRFLNELKRELKA